MLDRNALQNNYRTLVAAMSTALASNDDLRFGAALDGLIQLREKNLFAELRRLTTDLQASLERFRLDSRIMALAGTDVPNARHRLEQVLKLTDSAAHKTMDLVEHSGPIAFGIGQAASEAMQLLFKCRAAAEASPELRVHIEQIDFILQQTENDSKVLCKNMHEVLMAQEYQDVTGQIIRGVMNLVTELESVLGELSRLSTGMLKDSAPSKPRPNQGPALPGIDKGDIVTGQSDVDSLMSGMGR
jgi:chemotaxis protein CheZ